LQETEITGSSGDLKVDAAALAVVRHAAPFERFPAEIGDLAEIHAVSILQFEPAAR
jgi:outer membrane biosynthesis protein TonB